MEHIYDYDVMLINQSKRDDLDKNTPIYLAIDKLAKEYGIDVEIHHFISKRSTSPNCLYEDFEVQGIPFSIQSKLDAILKNRYLTSVEVSDNKGFLDIEQIKKDLFSIAR